MRQLHISPTALSSLTEYLKQQDFDSELAAYSKANGSFSTYTGKIDGGDPVILDLDAASTYGEHWVVGYGYRRSELMKKKVLSSVLAACCLVGCLSIPVAAAEAPKAVDINLEAEIYNAINGISDVPITDAMLDGAVAAITDDDGNVLQAIDVDMTVKEIPASRSSSVTTYVATYVARANKTDSGTTTKDDVVATATVTWNDILGTTNELISVSGGWTVSGTTLSSRKVAYGSKTLNGETYTETKPRTPTAFIILLMTLLATPFM